MTSYNKSIVASSLQYQQSTSRLAVLQNTFYFHDNTSSTRTHPIILSQAFSLHKRYVNNTQYLYLTKRQKNKLYFNFNFSTVWWRKAWMSPFISIEAVTEKQHLQETPLIRFLPKTHIFSCCYRFEALRQLFTNG